MVYSIDELNDNIVRIYVENGLIVKFGVAQKEPEPPEEDKCPTFQLYAEKWSELYKVPNLKQMTCNGYCSMMRRHLFPFFGEVWLDEITMDAIQQFLNEKDPLAHNTVHPKFILFSAIMESLYEDKLIPGDLAKSKRLSITSKERKDRER